MYVADLALTDYRSYEQAVVSFPPGATVLVGSNGQGKTNLVESINYLATLSSHRVGADTALVRRDASGQNQPNAAVIRAKLITAARPQLLEVEIISGKANRARLNRAAHPPPPGDLPHGAVCPGRSDFGAFRSAGAAAFFR